MLRSQESFTSHGLAFHEEVQPTQSPAQQQQQQKQQQNQRPLLRSQESFISHSLSYHSHDAESYTPFNHTAADSASPVSYSGAYIRNKHIHGIRTPSSFSNHCLDTNDYGIDSYNTNNSSRNTNDNVRHLHDSTATFDDELYDDFAEDLNQTNYETASQYSNYNHGNMARRGHNPPLMIDRHQIRQSHSEQYGQQRDRFNYNGNFQLQRGRYNQSERVIRDNHFPVNDGGYDDANYNRNMFQQQQQQQQSHSYRHVPSYNTTVPAQPHQQRSPALTSQQLSQSYHMQNNNGYDNSSTYRNQTQQHVPPKPIQSSLSSRNVIEPLKLEISPGVFATVRGANETEHAVSANHLIHLPCMACTMNISCIADAQYVLCPICKVIGPTNTTIRNGVGGVGLGFCTDD